MAKLGWVAALLMGSMLAIGAVASPVKPDTSEEVKAILLRMERVQIADVHPRLFKHGFHPGNCDSDEVCRILDEGRELKGTKEENLSHILDRIEKAKGKEVRARWEALAAEEAKKAGK